MRDRDGYPVTAHDVLADHELETHYRGRPWPRYTGYEHLAIGADPGEVWRQMHENCGHSWECVECGRAVCSRCEVSPAEFVRCSECDWFRGGAA